MTAASAEMLRQRRDHQRRDVLPPRADRGGRRRAPARRRDHRHAADPAARACRRSSEQLRDAPSSWRPERRRTGPVEYGIGPHAAYTVPLPVLREAAAAAAREHDLLLHLHVAETATEGAELLAAHGLSRAGAARRARRPRRPGAGRPLRAHGRRRPRAVAEYDVAVAHCPASNAKLASGIAPLRAMLDRGIRVGHGHRRAGVQRRRSTCSPTCGWPPRSPGWRALGRPRLTAAGGVLAGHRRRRRRRSAGRTSAS